MSAACIFPKWRHKDQESPSATKMQIGMIGKESEKLEIYMFMSTEECTVIAL